MSNLSLNEESYTKYGTIPTIRSEHRARSFSDSESTNGKLPLMMSPGGHNGLPARPSCGQNGITTPGVTNGYTDGCIKCKLEQMARRWSQGDCAIQDDLMLMTQNNLGFLTQQHAGSQIARFPQDIRPCRGKYYLLRHGSRFYLLQFPCCKSR